MQGESGRPAERLLRHVPELDGLRGLAALAVFFHHVCVSTVHTDVRWGPITELVRSASIYGNAGVDVFFVLSGFLITSTLLNGQTKPDYYAPFYWKRLLRIVPVYVCVLLYVVLSQPHSAFAVWCAVFFAANLSLLAHVPPVPPFWSLAIEEQFYLVWPSLVHRRSPRVLLRWAACIALGTVLLRVVFALRGHYNYFLTFLHCDGLAAGALLACLYVEGRRRSGAIRALLAGSWTAGLVAWLVGRELPGRMHEGVAMGAAVSLTAVTLLSLGLVGTLVFYTGSRWLGIFRGRVLVYFGLISYCFYLVHLYVAIAYDGRWSLGATASEAAFWGRFAVILVGSVLVSTVSRYGLELPVQRLRRYIPVLQTRAARAEQARVSP